MKTAEEKCIWTIGHSTHTLEKFVAMLHSFEIALVADIRSFPGSRRYPQFNKESLALTLPENHIQYTHIRALGGRRKVKAGSLNTAWKNAAFQGYADYMETDDFKEEIEILERTAVGERTAFMCSEAVWWRCHRSMVSDELKVKGWKVMHIMDIGKAVEHPYTSVAKIVNGELKYGEK
ncbi:MAG: DUF488 domain-containing protein [Bacteroidota bacterium]|nr:DUF488 domain-containing protein [Bacteroidota bacterium]MDP4249200.1 DUF488 domain-containing protein [Bacteroidota bacterium]